MHQPTIWKLGVVTLMLGGAVVMSSIDHATPYKMVDQLIAGGLDDWGDRELKIHNFVETGTIVEAVIDHEVQRSFVLAMAGKRIRVFSKGPKPDTFKDNSEVVATGRLRPAGELRPRAAALCTHSTGGDCPIQAAAEQPYVVEATELMAKCPSHY